MGLIPEAWFRRRATFTGQETFLPREKLLDRIRRIQELKDRHSLEEIGQLLSPDLADRVYSLDELSAGVVLSARARDLFPTDIDAARLRFSDLVCLAAIDELSRQGGLADEHVRLAGVTLLKSLSELKDVTGERHLVLAERDGATVAMIHTGQIVFDEPTKVLVSLNVDQLIEDLKVRLREAVA